MKRIILSAAIIISTGILTSNVRLNSAKAEIPTIKSSWEKKDLSTAD